MRLLILDTLWRHWFAIVVLLVLGFPLSSFSALDREIPSPSFFFAPMLVLVIMSRFIPLIRARGILTLLPISRGKVAFSLWFMAVGICPLVATIPVLPYLLSLDLLPLARHFLLFTLLSKVSIAKLCASVLAAFTMSSAVFLWCALRPSPAWERLPRWAGVCLFVLWALMLLLTPFLLTIPAIFRFIIPAHLENWVNSLPGLVFAVCSLALFRRLQVGTAPLPRKTGAVEVSQTPPYNAHTGVTFQRVSYPLVSLCMKDAIGCFAVLCIAIIIFYGCGLLSVKPRPWQSRFLGISSPTADKDSIRMVAWLFLYVSGAATLWVYSHWASMFRVLRGLPVPSWRLSLCVTAALGTLFLLTATPLVWLARVSPVCCDTVLRYGLLINTGVMILAAVFLGRDLLLSRRVISVVIGLIIATAASLYSFPALFSLLSNPLYSNAIGLLLSVAASAWMLFVLTHSRWLYQLKPEKGDAL